MGKIFRNEANFIKHVITHPCAQPWFVLIETFIPAFLGFAWTVMTFDLEDLIREHARGLAGGGALGGGRAIRHSSRARVVAQAASEERIAARGLKHLITLTQPLEFIGFWWLVYGATDDFFYDWLSLLQERQYCSAQLSSGPLQRHSDQQVQNFNVNGVAINLEHLDMNRANWPTNPFSVAVPDGIYQVILAVTAFDQTGSGLSDCGVRLRITGGLGHTFIESSLETIPGGGGIGLIADATIIMTGGPGNAIAWEAWSPTHALGIATISTARLVVARIA